MKLLELTKINKEYFGHEDIARILGITPAAARVFAHRYAKYKILIRAKRGIYILRERWKYFSREQKFEIANLLHEEVAAMNVNNFLVRPHRTRFHYQHTNH